MKRVLLFLVLVIFFVAAVPASAQSEFRLPVVQVQLLPEYDQPSMLVLITVQLPDDAELPMEVSVRIPASVGEPHAVAVLDDTGLVTRDYERTVSGDWALVTLMADQPIIQVEYYDPALSQSDNPRNYDFTFSSVYPIDDLVVSVQQPIGATGIALDTAEPIFGSPQTQSDGLNYYTATPGALEVGEEFNVSLSYTKNNTALTVESLFQQQPAAPVSSSTGNSMPVWGWALIAVGVVVLGAGAYFYVKSSKSTPPPSKHHRSGKKKKRPAKRTSKPSSASSGKLVFCHQCGTEASKGDKYCRECGTKLRV